jgi:hypothetical protein
MSVIWMIEDVRVREGDFYRYAVSGWVMDGGSKTHLFSWQVPSLNDPRYQLTEAARRQLELHEKGAA